jgi:hypothetical protein
MGLRLERNLRKEGKQRSGSGESMVKIALEQATKSASKVRLQQKRLGLEVTTRCGCRMEPMERAGKEYLYEEGL